ncbi:hypothetical protein [Flavobacterium terrigena]|uniref:Uncharacterized protein n=1 Tax=Flavobacterium terrigena TaxID=402734 RepID=A0A1H6UKR8_9FLAO|nr:hypothetical protein [Flavobacterium terrigena]SEI92901.1 hypothetical protein SAMN05660918_1950 [Flavobacterium terrigena]
MKSHFLFPNQLKKIGWLLFVPSVLATLIISVMNISTDDYLNITVFSIYNGSIGEASGFFKFIKNSILDEILTIGIIVGGILVGFSKLKEEDEMISKIRYESLVWATYLNYGIILFFTLFLFGLPYLNVLFYNIFTLLLFFIIRFHYMIYKLNNSNHDE